MNATSMAGPSISELAERFQSNVWPAMREELGTHLGVSPDSLAALGIGFCPIVPFERAPSYAGWWSIPERNADGEVIGIGLRSTDGKGYKCAYPGSHRGLVFPVNPDHRYGSAAYKHGAENWVRTMAAGVECPICGKPDGCVVSVENPEDPKAVICIRVKEGAVKPMRFGYLHIRKPQGNIRAGASALRNNGGPVLIVEGMSDTAAALGIGFDAVGRPSNLAGLDLLASLVKGRRVIVIGENDKKPNGDWPGRDGVLATANVLMRPCSQVTTVMPPKGVKDLRAWTVNHNLTHDGLLAYAAAQGKDHTANHVADEGELVVINADEVEDRAQEFIVPGYIPQGIIMGVVGESGIGKTHWFMDLAARVTNGIPIPVSAPIPVEEGTVLYICAEDSVQTLKRRARAAGVNLSKLKFVTFARTLDENGKSRERMFNIERDYDKLVRVVKSTPDLRIILIDPVTAFLGRADSYRATEVRDILTPLARLAEDFGLTVLFVQHFAKSHGANGRSMNGSEAFESLSRVVLIIVADPTCPERRLLGVKKSNLGALPATLGFRLIPSEIEGIAKIGWEPHPIPVDVRELLRADYRAPRHKKRNDCAAWLETFLRDGLQPVIRVIEQGKLAGFSERTLQRAADELMIEKKPLVKGGPWYWGLATA